MSDHSGVKCTKVDQGYFENFGLRCYAGVWSLWVLGAGAVIQVTSQVGTRAWRMAGETCSWPPS